MIHGIDVSHHQGGIDWPVVARTVSFAVVKATEGLALTDENFRHNVKAAGATSLMVGAYHFARPDRANNDAMHEARVFLDVVDGLPVDFVALDLEVEVSGMDVGRWASEWLDIVQRERGQIPLLYTGLAYAVAHLTTTSHLGDFPLWLAAYRNNRPPAPKPWGRWTIWQYTSTAKVAGVHGNVDVNIGIDGLWTTGIVRGHGPAPQHGTGDGDMTPEEHQTLKNIADTVDRMEEVAKDAKNHAANAARDAAAALVAVQKLTK